MSTFVLVFSEGNIPARDICENIIKSQGEEIQLYDFEINESKYFGYTCNLKAKYYNKNIILFPVKDSIDNIKLDIQDNVEAVIVYFDSKNKKCVEQICKYSNYMKAHNIENGLILFDNDHLSEDDISCSDISDSNNFVFNFIDLGEASSSDNEYFEHRYGYDGVIQTLCNLEWLNMKTQSEVDGDGPKLPNSCDGNIDSFENLVMKIQAFKSISSTLQRAEVLNHAEQLATQFIQLMNSDVDDDL